MCWMNCEPVCASLLWFGTGLLFTGGCLGLLYFVDEDLGRSKPDRLRRVWAVAWAVVSLMLWRYGVGQGAVAGLAYGCLAVYLVLCSVMDYFLKMVCDFFHYIGLLGGGLLLLYSPPSLEAVWSLLCFVLIQKVLFMKMYGPADGVAFVICAMYLTARGNTLEDFLMHMASTFVLLGVVQGYKRNISANGNLKHPVALLPYITAGFFVII